MNTKELMALIERYRTAGGREEHHTYKEELERVVDELIHENHNLNWALNNDGYAELYTEAERSENAEAAEYIEAFSIKLKQAKEQYTAMVADAERYKWLATYFCRTDTTYDDPIVACENKEQLDAVIDAAMGKK